MSNLNENINYTVVIGIDARITLAEVHAALAYYYDHLEEIRKDIEDDEVFTKEMKSQTPSLVQQKLQNGHG